MREEGGVPGVSGRERRARDNERRESVSMLVDGVENDPGV